MIATDFEININQSSTKLSILKDIKAYGPENALLCIIPGLGYTKVNENKLPLWIVGVSLGLTASLSYYQKIYYYKLYSASGFTDKSNYNYANNYNKAFLISSSAFVCFSLFDFTYSIFKGYKNSKSASKYKNIFLDRKYPILLKNQ